MFDCAKCKNFETEICECCSLYNGDKCCTCFQGNAPCGYCENICFEENIKPNPNIKVPKNELIQEGVGTEDVFGFIIIIISFIMFGVVLYFG